VNAKPSGSVANAFNKEVKKDEKKHGKRDDLLESSDGARLDSSDSYDKKAKKKKTKRKNSKGKYSESSDDMDYKIRSGSRGRKESFGGYREDRSKDRK
jgi:hypothetical protein